MIPLAGWLSWTIVTPSTGTSPGASCPDPAIRTTRSRASRSAANRVAQSTAPAAAAEPSSPAMTRYIDEQPSTSTRQRQPKSHAIKRLEPASIFSSSRRCRAQVLLSKFRPVDGAAASFRAGQADPLCRTADAVPGMGNCFEPLDGNRRATGFARAVGTPRHLGQGCVDVLDRVACTGGRSLGDLALEDAVDVALAGQSLSGCLVGSTPGPPVALDPRPAPCEVAQGPRRRCSRTRHVM